MHAIRSAAHKQAWYSNEDDENRTYNIFGRFNPNPRRQQDPEKDGVLQPPLDHSVTESDAPSPVETKRREGYKLNNNNGIKKAGTFPSSPVGDRPVSRDPPLESDMKEKFKGSSDTDLVNGSTDAQGQSSTVHPTDRTTTEEAEGTRKRKRFHIPFIGKKNKDELERTNTSESRKKKKKKYPHPKLTIGGQLKAIFGSYINILLVFVPVGIAVAHVSSVSGVVVFILNFVAIIPLAAMLSYATEELAIYVGETLGGLLNASFGNAVELIVSIIALTQQKVLIVQTSLIGSMLSNLLLVMGMCFFCGGVNRVEQFFNITVAQTAASLLALAIGSLVMPTAFRIFSPDDVGVTPLSRATSVLLLFIYACYLLFQLRTHTAMYNEPSKKSPKKPNKKKGRAAMRKGLATVGISPHHGADKDHADEVSEEQSEESQQHQDDESSDDEEEAAPQLTIVTALLVLAGSTVLIAITSDAMVSAIDAIEGAISQEFIGLILIPIVGNAAEHATAVTVAIKDKMDLAIGVAVGSSLQIALLILPVMVIVGWCGVGQYGTNPPVMDLNFDGFQVVVLFIAIILVNYLIQDGKSHWLEGVMLFTTYIIIATAAWYYPAVAVPT